MCNCLYKGCRTTVYSEGMSRIATPTMKGSRCRAIPCGDLRGLGADRSPQQQKRGLAEDFGIRLQMFV